MNKLRLPRVLAIPMAAPSSADRRLLQILLGAAAVAMLVALGGCAGDRNEDWVDSQRDTMSHGQTEQAD